jgi:hypothetical protein
MNGGEWLLYLINASELWHLNKPAIHRHSLLLINAHRYEHSSLLLKV